MLPRTSSDYSEMCFELEMPCPSTGSKMFWARLKIELHLGTIQALRHHVFDFLTPPNHLFDEVILEWSLIATPKHCVLAQCHF